MLEEFMVYYGFYSITYILLFVFYLRKQSFRNIFLITIFYLYLCTIFEITIMPDRYVQRYVPYSNENRIDILKYSVSLIPGMGFHSIKQYIQNTALFIPFGFMINLFLKEKRFKRTLLYSFGLTLLIEVSQFILTNIYIAERSADIDDIIMNTLGGIIGLGFFVLLNKLFTFLHKEYGSIK